MQRLLVATDFSARSDRALRRAVLLAKQTGAAICLVHVVDDDQPEAKLAVERDAAARLLDELATTLVTVDGVTADARVLVDVPFHGVTAAADAVDADLIVVGVPRRQLLRDVFLGTTVERAIRTATRPTLLAGGVPTAFYQQIMVATDLSEGSACALRAVAALGLDRIAAVTVAHVFEAALPILSARDGAIREQAQAWIASEQQKADQALTAFIEPFGLALPRRLLKLNEGSAAGTLLATAVEVGADLIVAGTRGRSGLVGLVLGSVTVELLRAGSVDVLVVPPQSGAAGAA